MFGKSLDGLLSGLNFFPSWKTRLAAVGAFGLAVIAAWNAMVPELGHGPCLATPEELQAGFECASDWSIAVPKAIEAAVLALLGVGVANKAKNEKAKQ